MADVRYIFGDLLTGEVIQEISLQGVSMAQTFAGGELRGTLHLDQTGKSNNDLTSATIPGRCFVVAERYGSPIWDGIVWTRTYQSQAKSAQLYCRDYKAYSEHRFIEEDIVLTGDQIAVFLTLFGMMQTDPSSIVVALPTGFTSGTSVTLDIKSDENKTFAQVIDSFADAPSGFDWLIKTSKLDGSYYRYLVLGAPTIGTGEHPGMVTFDYPGAITNYWKNETMGEAGTHFVAVGTGTGDTSIRSKVVDTALISHGFPRYDLDVPSKDVSTQALLDNLVIQQAIKHRAPMPVYTVQLKADQTPMFGDYDIGDTCLLHIEDPMHPDRFLETKRILGWQYTPASDDSVEEVQLVFEGDETE